MQKIKTLSLDLETFSDADLSKCGVYRYAEAPGFEILLFGYSVDGGGVRVIDLAQGEKIPDEILDALTDDSVTKWAFNANFERVCLSRYLSDLGISLDPFHDGHPLSTERAKFLSPESWRCSMVWSAYLGLPLSLKGVGSVLKLENQKMDEGKALIKYFSVPCAATAANAGRTRNLPSDAPEKWELFKAYNKRDVEVEMAIQKRLSRFPVPESVWEEYRIDQEINDRGVRIDMELVHKAIGMDDRSRGELTSAMKKLTHLENPNSVQQMKQWLADNGLEMDSLGKNEVAAALGNAPEELREVLDLRRQLAKSSVKKYQAMENAACGDGRARGMFQFYGANRTGRFSGRIIQLQNLPQNHIPDLAQARELVKSAGYEAVKALYGDVPDTLSQLIRTAFVPKEGCKFIVADFSAIEARVIAWYAGEQWKTDAFASGKDIYCETASRMFGKPVVKRGINGELRAKGKVAELACIAEGQPVLTNHGLIPIEKVTTDDLLWDGEEWVHHDGVIFKGEREVITYEGLTATPDHLVWIRGKPWPVQFGVAAACGAHLIQTGDGRNPIRMGENYQPGEEVEQKSESLLCFDRMPGMRICAMDRFEQPPIRTLKRMSALLPAETDSALARKATDRRKTAVRKSEQPRISQLRSERNKIFLSKRYSRGSASDKHLRTSGERNGNRPDQQRYGLCSRKSAVRYALGKQRKQTMYDTQQVCPGILAVCQKRGDLQTLPETEQRRNHPRSGNRGSREEKELEINQRTARLYDIRNAGRHHRFTISGKLVHNCGYGGSVGALKAMDALEMGLSEDELPSLVSAWRTSNPNIVKFWWDIDRAATRAVRLRESSEVCGIQFSYQSGFLFITLPSGRRLAYVKPRMGTNRFGSECVTYEGIGGMKKWERLETYGPKLVENIVQATSRDILCYAMKTLRCCRIVMHIHDELVIEADPAMSLDAVCEQMGRTPPWAKGLKLRADGYECDFYKKD